MKCAEETKSHPVLNCLYNYYMLTEQMDKVKQLMLVLRRCFYLNVTIANPSVVCYVHVPYLGG